MVGNAGFEPALHASGARRLPGYRNSRWSDKNSEIGLAKFNLLAAKVRISLTFRQFTVECNPLKHSLWWANKDISPHIPRLISLRNR